jgi:integrator complex subunit 1
LDIITERVPPVAQVRTLAASRLELWLQNPKLNRPAQDLLLAVCANCATHGARDVEVIAHLVKVRLKTKALVQFYLTAMRWAPN